MLTIVAMVAVGVVLTKIGWINEQVKDFLIKITVQLALPTLMFESVITDFTREEIIAMKSRILIPFASILLTMAVGIAMAYILHVDPKKRGLFISMFFNSNTIFVGLPVNLALNGKSCFHLPVLDPGRLLHQPGRGERREEAVLQQRHLKEHLLPAPDQLSPCPGLDYDGVGDAEAGPDGTGLLREPDDPAVHALHWLLHMLRIRGKNEAHPGDHRGPGRPLCGSALHYADTASFFRN